MENEAIETVSEVVEEAAPEIFVAVDTNKGFMKGVAAGSLAVLGCVAVCELVTKLVIPKMKQKKTYTQLHTVNPEDLDNYEEIEDDFE
ncbi:MAG: hypothetical protein LUE29_09545 [Lachnospiraceae bacterium]|nr:hypothetical protein [Lachnospiraceae bacterium]